MSQAYDVFDEGSANNNARPGTPVELRRLFGVLWRAKLIFLGAAALMLAVGFLVAKFGIQRSWATSATVEYVGFPGESPMDRERSVARLTAVADDEPILLRLRDDLGIPDANIDAMRAIINVESDPGTGLVTFRAYGDSAEEAASRADAVADLFLQHHRERRQRLLDNDLSSLDARLTAANNELKAAQEAYDAFREANGITELSSEQEGEISRAADLTGEADMAAAEVEALEARVAALRVELGATPETVTVTSTMGLQSSRLGELRQRLREARGQGLGDAHPQVQSLEAQVAALARQSGDGTSETRVNNDYADLQRSLRTARTELEATRQRAESLRVRAEEAQALGSRLSAVEGEAASLLAQVNVKESVLTTLTEERAAVEDQLMDVPTGFRRGMTAPHPEDPVPSKKKLLVAAAFPILALAILFVFVLFREFRGGNLISPKEIAWWGNGPVLGTSVWPKDPAGLFSLVADLSDKTEVAVGTLLVVGATEEEQILARRLAFGLRADWGDTTLLEVPDHPALPAGQAKLLSADEAFPDFPNPAFQDGRTELDLRIPDFAVPSAAQSDSGRFDPAQVPASLTVVTCPDITEPTVVRRAARRADGVMVVVPVGMKASDVASLRDRLGRDGGVGFIVVGVDKEVAMRNDRVGPVDDFWSTLSV